MSDHQLLKCSDCRFHLQDGWCSKVEMIAIWARRSDQDCGRFGWLYESKRPWWKFWQRRVRGPLIPYPEIAYGGTTWKKDNT